MNEEVAKEDIKYLKRYKIQQKLVQDLKDGVTGDGSLKGKKSIPGMKYAKNPWHDLDTPANRGLLSKVLSNYYG